MLLEMLLEFSSWRSLRGSWKSFRGSQRFFQGSWRSLWGSWNSHRYWGRSLRVLGVVTWGLWAITGVLGGQFEAWGIGRWHGVSRRSPKVSGRLCMASGKSLKASMVVKNGSQGNHLEVPERLPGGSDSQCMRETYFGLPNFIPSRFLQYLSF